MRLVYNLEFAFWVNSFLQERWYTPPRWLHGRLYTLWSSLDARRDARALEEKETREEFLEETMVTWTACHVELGSQSTDRLVHILKGATPLFVEKTMEGPWDEIMDHISGSCLKRAESQLLCAEDHARVHVILAAAMTEFFRRKPSFDRALDHGTWDRWECTLKLTGPFLLLDDLGQAEMEAFVSILQSRCSKNSKSSAAQLVAATRSLGPASTEQEKWIIAYAIYNLCIYIWVNEYNRSHRQVVDRLVEMIDIPHQTLPVATPYEMCLPLALSALYSVAFGKPERERHFWASAHPLYPAGRTDERLGAVQALHCAITNRIAATACQEQSLEMVQIHLKHLCRLLAYAPCIADDSKEVNRCIEIMEKLPHRFDNCHHLTHESSFTALPSIIWVHRASKIPRIHEYLEVFLSCQRRFPTLKPVWRSWHDIHASGHGNRLFSLFGHDKKWLDHFINDRRLTELLHAFDQLIEAGCSIDQHVVIVQLAIHDLSDNRGAHYHDYYTAARKMELQRLQDPALRLIGARAANMAYSGAIPHEDAPEWSSEPWIEAVRFWCEAYQKTDVTSDEALLQATLLQSNDVLHSAVMEASFDNKLLQVCRSSIYSSVLSTLQDRIRALLISTLDKCTDANTVLLLHVAAQTSSWFPDYLTEARVGKLVGILSTARPLSMRVLPVLATLLSPIHDPSQLIAILASAQRVLTENSHYPGQNEVCELAASIEQTMHCPPQWIQSYKTTDEKTWRRIWDSLNETACTLQEQENFSRTFIRWNGGSHSRQRYRRRSTFNSGLEMGLETLHQEDALRDSSSLNRFQQPGLGTRLLGLLHRPDRGENHEGDSSYMGDAQMSNLALSGQRNPFVIDDDWESIQLAEGSNDRRYSCSAAWDI